MNPETVNRPYRRMSAKSETNIVTSNGAPSRDEAEHTIPMESLENTTADPIARSSTSGLIPGQQLRAMGYTESTIVPRQNLGIWDVASVVLNKMVGTGIYTTPGQVLRLTGSKKLSVALWIIGGIYTGLCLTVYLELGSQFPHNGGELIYLSRTLSPGLLWALAFSAFFIMIANTTGNAIAFARFVMIAASPEYTTGEELNSHVVKLIAVDVLSIVCLLHYFSGRLGLFLNKTLALYKVCLLIAVMGALIWVIKGPTQSPGLGKTADQFPATALSKLTAVVLVLYSFTGWENANYVAGEIICDADKGPAKTLRRGAYTAVAIVTLLYFLVSLLYYIAFSYCEIVAKLDVGMALNLGPLAFKPHGLSLDILFALSAFGNMVAVVYTSAKVKQVIARQRVLPFWKFLQKDIGSPKGGLLLHWIATTILIVATPVNSDGYSFVIGLYTYGQIVVVTVATIGFAYHMCYNKLPDLQAEVILLKPKFLRWAIATVVVLANVLILVTGAAQKQSFAKNSQGELPCNLQNIETSRVPRWLWPAVTFPIFAFGALYWGVIRILMIKRRSESQDSSTAATYGSSIGFKVSVYEIPARPALNLHAANPTVRRNFIANSAIFDWPEKLNLARIEAIKDGTRRRIDVELSKIPATLAKVWSTVAKWIERNVI